MLSNKNESNQPPGPMQEGVVSWEKKKAKEFGLKSQNFDCFSSFTQSAASSSLLALSVVLNLL